MGPGPLMRFTTTVLFILACALAAAGPASAHHLRLGDRTLVRGHEGSDVKQLQRLLSRAGLRTGADGDFGRGTHRSVYAYERRFGLRKDGRVSVGQARGLYGRAGRRVPSSFGRPRPASLAQAPPAAPAGFPIAGPTTWEEGFGTRDGRHRGVDLFADCGTPLVATADGTIRHVKSDARAGRYVVLNTAGGHDDVFMHMRSVRVEQGDTVKAGEPIGSVGATGNASGCHLHFERWTAPGWYRGGEAIDPEPALREAQKQAG